ncbi:MAG: hypothetical protein B6230_06380 [Desulfobacteraceae bacterium 4572_89]|nr:MAG: hypothetical protein B6230_06380 [Desulfobacteraceae bacterium 4572_89]
MILHDFTYKWDGKSRSGEKPIAWWPGAYRVRIIKLGDDSRSISYLFPIAVVFKSMAITGSMDISLKNYIDNFAKKISKEYDLEVDKTLWVELGKEILVAQLHPDRKLSDEILYSISWRPVRPNELSMIESYITDL